MMGSTHAHEGRAHRTTRKVVTAGIATAAALVLAAGPAQAAVSYSLHAASDYAQAQTWTTNGNQGRSYAKHGNLSVSTGWTLSSSRAFADAGTSSTYAAQVWWQ